MTLPSPSQDGDAPSSEVESNVQSNMDTTVEVPRTSMHGTSSGPTTSHPLSAKDDILQVPPAPTESPSGTEGSVINEQPSNDEEKMEIATELIDDEESSVLSKDDGQQPDMIIEAARLVHSSLPTINRQNFSVNSDEVGANDSQQEHSVGSSQQPSTSTYYSEVSGTPVPRLSSTRKKRRKKKGRIDDAKIVRFSDVRVREYNITIGDNPCCSYGPPMTLDWDYSFDNIIPVDVFESHPRRAMKRRNERTLLMSATERRSRLWRAGHSLESIDAIVEELERYKWRDSVVGNLEPLYALQGVWQAYVKPIFYTRAMKARRLDQQLDRIEARVRAEHCSQASSVEFTVGTELRRGSNFDIFEHDEDDDSNLIDEGDNHENNPIGPGRYVEKATGKEQSILIEGMATMIEREKPSHEDDSDSSYGIEVDARQQDKATQIILKSFRRPHMRAFHASWFSFFVAFFSWFAITPLLSEIQVTLGLTDSDIWLSSLFGTLGTIVMRIVMGPLCDAFGARRCMAFILAVTAVPTALTGLIETSIGLSLIRLFIGFGGSSFVACQYWSHEMFTREVAGTANALVAGWGNLGGGFTNLIMGSALFPLFRWIFREEDDNEDSTTASELAWRSICIFPAVLCLVTAFLILFYTDDTPKGSYRQRIRSEKKMLTSPMDSLCHALKNWNVWILTLQYACCFGVEVTMTNATALYFRDEFGQSTVSAAAIASIFGFMNIFARALGGLGSDLLNARKGIRGRLIWQTVTLFMEGVAVVIFAYSTSLAGSICALIFLSIFVQGAEGSTFGIVPYVDRRFTGSVVGVVGSGGNVGAAIFSVFFVQFHYRPAFLMMGVSAVGSSMLCILMNTRKLARTYEAVMEEVLHRYEDDNDEDEVDDEDNDSKLNLDDLDKPKEANEMGQESTHERFIGDV